MGKLKEENAFLSKELEKSKSLCSVLQRNGRSQRTISVTLPAMIKEWYSLKRAVHSKTLSALRKSMERTYPKWNPAYISQIACKALFEIIWKAFRAVKNHKDDIFELFSGILSNELPYHLAYEEEVETKRPENDENSSIEEVVLEYAKKNWKMLFRSEISVDPFDGENMEESKTRKAYLVEKVLGINIKEVGNLKKSGENITFGKKENGDCVVLRELSKPGIRGMLKFVGEVCEFFWSLLLFHPNVVLKPIRFEVEGIVEYDESVHEKCKESVANNKNVSYYVWPSILKEGEEEIEGVKCVSCVVVRDAIVRKEMM